MAVPPTRERLKATPRRFGVQDDDVLGAVTFSRLETLLDETLGPAVLPGLHVRRDKEADMVAHAGTENEPSELCRVRFECLRSQY